MSVFLYMSERNVKRCVKKEEEWKYIRMKRK